MENGKPEGLVWSDPRTLSLPQSFNKVDPYEIEFSVCAIPKRALEESGGIDEAYDVGAAVAEKELTARLGLLGYEAYLDTSIEYRAVKHERLHGSKVWDKAYFKANDLYQKHIQELRSGARPLNINSLVKYT